MSDIDDRIALRRLDQKGGGSIYFRHKDFWVLLSVNRFSDKKEVNRLVAKHGLDKPASKHQIKHLGFRLEITDTEVEIFTYSKTPITVGDCSWLYNVKRSTANASLVCSISLRVSHADKPTKVDFLTKQKIDAALEAYRYGVSQCELQLRNELMRIYSDSSHKLKDELLEDRSNTPTNPNTAETSPKTPVKRRIVRFKSSG